MPEKILCKNCNFLLYFGEIIKKRLYMRNLPSEETVLDMYGNNCPRCNNELSLEKVNIQIER